MTPKLEAVASGVEIKQVTDALKFGVTYYATQYPTRKLENCDGTRLLILAPYNFELWDGCTFERITTLPMLGDGNEPVWAKSDHNLLYYHRGNALYSYDVVTSQRGESDGRGHTEIFSEYSEITFGGKSDISYDGDHLVICGKRGDYWDIFLYTISTHARSQPFVCQFGFGNAFVTPDNNVLITRRIGFAEDVEHTQGIELFSSQMLYQREVCNVDGHFCITRDTDGQECIVWDNSADPHANAHQIVKVRLSDGWRTPLFSLDWSTLATHTTCPEQAGFAIVETYDPHNPVSTVGLANEILKVPLDGSSVVENLLEHGTDSADYNSQPRAVVDREGKRIFFNSNVSGVLNVYCATLSATPVAVLIDVTEQISLWQKAITHFMAIIRSIYGRV